MMKVKVLVVDDSAFMRKVITDLLESDEGIEVVGTARNGLDALEKIPKLQPDVVTLDVEMPKLDGLKTLEEIISKHGLPVIMLSSTTQEGAENTLIALEKGAFDFIAKPSGSISLDIHKVKDEMIHKVHLAARSKQVLKRPRRVLQTIEDKQPIVPVERVHPTRTQPERTQPDGLQPETEQSGLSHLLKNVVLVGTSTGGPKALNQLFSQLPSDKHTAYLVVQHMPPGFTKSLANRLNQMTPHNVKEAADGEVIKGGCVYIAPGGWHMEIKPLTRKLALHLHQKEPRGGHRPSVDVLFESAATIKGYSFFAVVLTGMGKDGSSGLRAIKDRRDIYCIAEDESTCIVYGMPRAVVQARLANLSLPLDEIPDTLSNMIKQ